MAKASNTTVEVAKTNTAVEISPSLAEIHAQAQLAGSSPAGAMMSNAKSMNARALADKLAKKGSKVEYAGGSLPSLTFQAVGEAHLVRYTGDKEVEGDDGKPFTVLAFDLLDSDRYPEIEVLSQASLIKAATLADVFATVAKSDILIITYHGRGTAKKGWSPPHLYSVDKVS